jgi:hypothetical protein
VLAAPWRKPEVALTQLETIRNVRAHATDAIAARMQGILQTTWTNIAQFARAYFGELQAPNPNAQDAVLCFKSVMRELRAMDGR